MNQILPPQIELKKRQESAVAKSITPNLINNFDNSFINKDYGTFNIDEEQKLRAITPQLKRDLRPFTGQLPYHTTPKTWENPQLYMIPETTRVSNVCFNDALYKSGPWYLRHWQIWDNAPFLPSSGDVTKDPRYGMQTKSFTTEYYLLPK